MKLFYPPNSYCNELAGLSGAEGCIIVVIIIICSLSLSEAHSLLSFSSFASSLLSLSIPSREGGREAAVTAAACFMLLSRRRRRRRRQRGGPTDGMARSTPSSPPSKPQFLPPPVFQASRMRRARARLDKADFFFFFLPLTDLLFSLLGDDGNDIYARPD